MRYIKLINLNLFVAMQQPPHFVLLSHIKNSWRADQIAVDQMWVPKAGVGNLQPGPWVIMVQPIKPPQMKKKLYGWILCAPLQARVTVAARDKNHNSFSACGGKKFCPPLS